MRKRISKRKYLFVFGITALVFVLGLLVGIFFSSEKLADVRELQDNLRSDTLDLEVLYTVLESNPCEYVNTTPLSDQLYDVAKRLEFMETQLGKNNQDVLQLKKYYSVLQMRQWMFEERVVEECQTKKNIILYFYDNEPGACPECEEQGFVLSYIREKYPFVSIYSFDTQTQSQAVQALVRRYVEEVPTIVIGDEIVYGFQSRAAIEEEILEQTTQLQNRSLQ